MSDTCEACGCPEGVDGHDALYRRIKELEERKVNVPRLLEAIASSPGAEERDALVAAIRRMTRLALFRNDVEMPTIVCLCGSTRFWETFRDQGLKLTMEGKIVLSIGTHAPDSVVLAHPETEEGKRQKRLLDELHKRKIDLADEVLILNVGGYIGSSTTSELRYARAHNKTVRFLEPEREVSQCS